MKDSALSAPSLSRAYYATCEALQSAALAIADAEARRDSAMLALEAAIARRDAALREMERLEKEMGFG